MTTTNTDEIMNQPRRVQALRGMVETVADRVAPLVDPLCGSGTAMASSSGGR